MTAVESSQAVRLYATEQRERMQGVIEDFEVEIVSTCGPVRTENQDAAVAWRGDQGEVVAIVSDGMGGHEDGREAAEIVIRSCLETLRSRNGQEWEEALRKAVETAHRQVRASAGERPEAQMGATVVVASVDGAETPPTLNVAHVGDSRAYLCRGRSIYRLTVDHSLVSQLVLDGHLTEEEAFGHPDNNIIHRAIGQSGPLEPDVQAAMPLERGDVVVLSSDGLHGVLSDVEILEIVRRAGSAKAACAELVDAAIQANSEDNISVACMRFPEGSRPLRPTRPSAEG